MSLPDVFCHNCRDLADAHVSNKCPYAPTHYEPTVVCSGWSAGGVEAAWPCPACAAANVRTGLTPGKVVEEQATCTACSAVTWVVA